MMQQDIERPGELLAVDGPQTSVASYYRRVMLSSKLLQKGYAEQQVTTEGLC